MYNQNAEQISNAKLYYFSLNGKANPIRAVLTWKKVEYEDVKYDFSSWPAAKKSGIFEFEQMPMLEVNGKKLTQTNAILQYLAKLFNISGSSAYEEYLIASLLNSLDDFSTKLMGVMWPRTDEQKANLEKNTNEVLTVHAPFFLKRWEDRFNDNGKNYMVGDSLTLADICITVGLFNVFKNKVRKETWEPVLNENAPNLSKLVQRIAENELSEYFLNVYLADLTI
jgi:glutathione S-transferase